MYELKNAIGMKIGAWSGTIVWVTSHLFTHKCYPTTDWCGYFELLSFLPRPIRISSDNLVISSSQELTILTPALVRTPNQHAKMLIKLPDSDHPQDSSPPVAWVTDSATKSSCFIPLEFANIRYEGKIFEQNWQAYFSYDSKNSNAQCV